LRIITRYVLFSIYQKKFKLACTFNINMAIYEPTCEYDSPFFAC
jgi:hypothetical protein